MNFVSKLLVLLVSGSLSQQPRYPVGGDHIAGIIRELPAESKLRRHLLHGDRGNGVHQPWMDAMRRLKIRRAVAWANILFDKKGRPKQVDIGKVECYAEYEGGDPLMDAETLATVRTSGLERELNELAQEQARVGSWFDVPRKNHDFLGGAQIVFLDDEWLPVIPRRPMYFAK